MKGQANIVSTGLTAIIIAVFVLVGLVVYGYLTDVTPHDKPYTNESMCTTCTPRTAYTFDNIPVLNGSTLACTNASGTTALVWDKANGTLGYELINADTAINLTHNGDTASYYTNVRCDYTHDEANTNEQSFYDNNTANTLAGFALAAVISIVVVAVALVALVVLLRGA